MESFYKDLAETARGRLYIIDHPKNKSERPNQIFEFLGTNPDPEPHTFTRTFYFRVYVRDQKGVYREEQTARSYAPSSPSLEAMIRFPDEIAESLIRHTAQTQPKCTKEGSLYGTAEVSQDQEPL
ncbi:MAG: hypothetical protein Q8P81_04540 [Nanoarchaeota archaeon]|nr:hypothetical protein [Nanoarchaeota archaeon]